ncbi:hypothetical protein FTI75_28805 [Burkholderia pseudomallei]|nr:hypothetical protein BOC46_35940 [Burkholderia pseudomallei]MBG1248291.1 hypothetical protein [Burkholderia pseudomallei]RIV45705.1 hypothetical protein D2W70_27220 [Burkholderia pseudomallei]RIV60103.1 hypothetical protein D2W49_19015 [Burkholderia pseudomallei]RIV64098.1 hypothetical protein D2W72_25440 [Burkholderia pseudomallei]
MRAAGRSIGARAAVGARDTCNPCNARATIGACDARYAIRGDAAPDTRRAAALTPPRSPLRTRRAAGSRRRRR